MATATKKTASKKGAPAKKSPSKKAASKKKSPKRSSTTKAASKSSGRKTNKLGVKNSLVNNINAHKKRGDSKSKKKSTVSKKSYKQMKDDWDKD